MCSYRKTIYTCNHTLISPKPTQPCQTQRDYESGRRTSPCDEMSTHGRHSVKVPYLCSSCNERKSTLDKQFTVVKTQIKDLKKQLKESYGECVSHMDEAGIETEKKLLPASEAAKTAEEQKVGAKSDSNGVAPVDTTEKLDPAAEFLRRKKLEDDAHLMMFWDFQ